jgi:transcriptional regulator with XRE-family HTH domain
MTTAGEEPRLIVMSPLGRYLRRLIIAHRLSHKDLSQRANISMRTIRQIEGNPNHRPRQQTLIKLARAFGLEPESLLTFLEIPRG